MIKQFYTKLSFLIIGLFPFMVYADFTITPIKLVIKGEKKITTMTVKNNNNQAKKFQLVAYKVSNTNGKETITPTKDLLITPVTFNIPARQSQLVRVAVKNSMYNHQKNGYRLMVQEVPPPPTVIKNPTQVQGQVQFTTSFNVPVSIESATAETE